MADHRIDRGGRRAAAAASALVVGGALAATLGVRDAAAAPGMAALFLGGGGSGGDPATVQNSLVKDATTGAVTRAGTGSPNRFLYSRWNAAARS